MKYKEQMNGVQTLLESKRELAVADFVSAMPGVPMTSGYAKIRSLERREGTVYNSAQTHV